MQLPHANRLDLPNFFECVGDRRAAEWWATGQAFVEYRADRINVRRRSDALAAAKRLLGGHISRRPENVARGRRAAIVVELLGQPKVRDLERPGRFIDQQDIGRLEIAMDNAIGMSLGDSRGDLRR